MEGFARPLPQCYLSILTGPEIDRIILGYADLDSQDLGLRNGEKIAIATGSGRYQIAFFDMALCNYAIEGCKHALEGLHLFQTSNVGELSIDSRARRGVVCGT